MSEERPGASGNGKPILGNPWRSLFFPIAAAFLPGFLAGTQVTGILFFLNPHLPFDGHSIVRGIALYGCALGFLSLALILPFTWGRPGRARSWLPITLTIVLSLASLSAWIHASKFAFFLPAGINRRLVKAAFWLTLAALIAFYTVLLHRMRQRPYGWRSSFLFTLIAILSMYVVLERREAFRPTSKPTPRPSTFQDSERPILFLVGIESATLDAILPLAEQGRIPFLGQMLQEGAYARFTALRPTRPKALWATLATGKLPHRHGILGDHLYDVGFLHPGARLNLLPLGLGIERWGIQPPAHTIDSTSMRALPLWEIFARLDIPTSLIGWPLSQPPPQHVHTSISEDFFRSGGAATIFPENLQERARLFRTTPKEIDPVFTAGFGPDPPNSVLEGLAQDLWRRDLSLFLLDRDPQADVFFLMLPGLLEVSEGYFGAFSAIQFQGEQDLDSATAAQWVSAYYTHLDDILSLIWDSRPRPMLLGVVSVFGASGPSGLEEAERRILQQPALKGTIQGTDGLLMLYGDGIAPGKSPLDADLVDLVPTLLYGIGLPSARDFDGVVLTEAFDRGFLVRQPLTFIPSYETFSVPTQRR